MSDLIQIEGMQELIAKIKLLADDKDKRKETLLILRNVAKPTMQAAKYFAPRGKGNKNRAGGSLQSSIGLITAKSENPTILVGPRVKKGMKKAAMGRNTFGDGWYGAMVDQGHNVYRNPNPKRKNTRSKRSRVVGFVPGVKFMEQAKNSTETFATKDLQEKMTSFIQRRIDKLSTNV